MATRLGLVWRVNLGGAVDGSPAVSGGLVIAGSQAGRLAAYDLVTGSPIWAVDGLGAIAGSPAIVGERVVVGTLTGHVLAFGLKGERLWDWSAPGSMPAIWSSPAIAGRLVLVGISSQYGDDPLEAGRLVALDLATGRQVWSTCSRFACAPGGGIWSTPAIDSSGRGFVGVGNPVDGVLAFDVSTGRQLWETSFHADAGRDLDVGATPVLLEVDRSERLVVGSVAGICKQLDAGTGRAAWSQDLVDGSAVHGLIASPAYDGRQLYLASASPPTGVFALAPRDGRVIWRHATALPVYSSPAVGHGAVVFGTGAVFGDVNAGSLVALSSVDGALLWSYETKSAVRSSPAIVGRMVLVGDAIGDLLAFKPTQ